MNYTQNLILPHVARANLPKLYDDLPGRGLPPAITISWAT